VRRSGPIIIKEQVSEPYINAAAQVERVDGERGVVCMTEQSALFPVCTHSGRNRTSLSQKQKYNLENSIVKECP